ncbi:MAG: TFIIB-type zinc ribbon-containing protein [Methylococcaceae bacterium]
MANCINCSAPLLANTNRCRYCGAHNDVDLTGKHDYQVVEQSDRRCPHCEKSLETVDLNLGDAFLIERCKDCFGLFFDPGQVEVLLESAVANVFDINLQHLDNINKDRFQGNKPVKYVKCPVCQVLMNRNAYGYRSGVIIDRCKNHGVWLDSGEITHLLEWKKAGGQLLQERRAQPAPKKPVRRPKPADSYANNPLDYALDNAEWEVADAVASVVARLFKI